MKRHFCLIITIAICCLQLFAQERQQPEIHTVPENVFSVDYEIIIKEDKGITTIENEGTFHLYTATIISVSGSNNSAIPSSLVIHDILQSSNNLYRIVEIGNKFTEDNVTKGAFENCTTLTEITLPSTVTKIGDRAFKDCPELTKVNIPQDNTVLEEIGANAFENCSKLENFEINTDQTYTFPNSVKTIGDYAFAGCTTLNLPNLPSTVETIGNYAFNNCSTLDNSSIIANTGLTKIDLGVFDGCARLSSIEFPITLTEIGTSAFNNCGGLNSIKVPCYIEYIGQSAFSSAKEVFLEHTNPTNLGFDRGGSPFGKNTTVYIPYGSYDNYASNSNSNSNSNVYNYLFVEGKNTWEYAEEKTIKRESGTIGFLELCEAIPTRIDELTIEMDETTGNYINYHQIFNNDNIGKDFVVWENITIKRTVPNDKYYYMTMPFDITSWGTESQTDGTCFKVVNSNGTDVTTDYKNEESDIPTTENNNNYPPFYIYKFSSQRFADGNYHDDAFEYVTKNAHFQRGNAYAIGVDDNKNSLTFIFSKKCSEGKRFYPYEPVKEISTNPGQNSGDPIVPTKWKKVNFDNWIMLSNPFFSPITFGYSDENYKNTTAISGSGIQYAYAISTNEAYGADGEKAYKLIGKDFATQGNETVNPHDPIYVQYKENGSSINISYVPVPEQTQPQQIPAAAPRHSKIIDLALIADGEQLDHTEIKDNPLGADEYVIGEDFYKMFNSGLDEIYTMIGDSVECFANELNLQTSNRVVPLAFHIYNAGDFTLSLNHKANILDYKVYLRNLTDNTVTDLLMNDPTLHLGEGRIEGDYQIEIDYAPTAVSAVENDGNSKVYVLADGLLHIDNLGSSVVSLYDATGKLLSVTDPHSDNLELTLPARGIYFVNLRGSENSTVKVVY